MFTCEKLPILLIRTVTYAPFALRLLCGCFVAGAGQTIDRGTHHYLRWWPPDQGGTIYANPGNGFAVEDAVPFTLTAPNTTITGVNFWGGCYPAATCGAADVTLNFDTSSAGGPATLIQSFHVGGANQTATGSQIGGNPSFSECSYSASIAPLTLISGVQYFLGVGNDVGATNEWGMETTSAIGKGQDYSLNSFTTPGLTWQPIVENLAFSLTFDPAAVVVQISFGLTGGGLVCLMLLGYKVRRHRMSMAKSGY